MNGPVVALLSAVAASLLACASPPLAATPELGWQALQPGVDYTVITGSTAGSGFGADGRLHLVRIDPGRAPLLAAVASAGDRQPRTAAQWCRERTLAVAINLGMYRDDRLTNAGHAHVPAFIFSRRPHAMQDLNAKLLALPRAITHVMHVEGRPEASLSRGSDVYELSPSY